MKRMKKLLTLLAVLVLILGATYLAGKWNPEKEAEESTETVIFTLDADSVTQLGWNYGEEILFDRTEDGWVLAEDANFPVDASYLSTMLDMLGEISSSRTIENVEDWDQYGLEVPVCTVTVTTDTTSVLEIGNETAMGGERYFSIGDGNAYLVDESVLSPFCYKLYDVLEYERIPTMTDVTGMEVVSESQSYTLSCQENTGLTYFGEYAWVMEGRILDTDLTEDLITSFMDYSWLECVNYYAEDLAYYGMEDPAVTITLNYYESVSVSTGEVDEDGDPVFETRKDPVSFTLEIGNANGSCRYAKLPGSRMIYTISGSLVETLLNTTYYDLRPDEVLELDWDEVTSVDIILDGETYSLIREIRNETDEEGNVTEKTVYTMNGMDVEFEDAQNILDSLDSAGYASGTPDGVEEIRFLIHRNTEYFPEIKIAFFRYDSASCMTVLNGEATVFTERDAIAELTEAVKAMLPEQ